MNYDSLVPTVKQAELPPASPRPNALPPTEAKTQQAASPVLTAPQEAASSTSFTATSGGTPKASQTSDLVAWATENWGIPIDPDHPSSEPLLFEIRAAVLTSIPQVIKKLEATNHKKGPEIKQLLETLLFELIPKMPLAFPYDELEGQLKSLEAALLEIKQESDASKPGTPLSLTLTQLEVVADAIRMLFASCYSADSLSTLQLPCSALSIYKYSFLCGDAISELNDFLELYHVKASETVSELNKRFNTKYTTPTRLSKLRQNLKATLQQLYSTHASLCKLKKELFGASIQATPKRHSFESLRKSYLDLLDKQMKLQEEATKQAIAWVSAEQKEIFTFYQKFNKDPEYGLKLQHQCDLLTKYVQLSETSILEKSRRLRFALRTILTQSEQIEREFIRIVGKETPDCGDFCQINAKFIQSLVKEHRFFGDKAQADQDKVVEAFLFAMGSLHLISIDKAYNGKGFAESVGYLVEQLLPGNKKPSTEAEKIVAWLQLLSNTKFGALRLRHAFVPGEPSVIPESVWAAWSAQPKTHLLPYLHAVRMAMSDLQPVLSNLQKQVVASGSAELQKLFSICQKGLSNIHKAMDASLSASATDLRPIFVKLHQAMGEIIEASELVDSMLALEKQLSPAVTNCLKSIKDSIVRPIKTLFHSVPSKVPASSEEATKKLMSAFANEAAPVLPHVAKKKKKKPKLKPLSPVPESITERPRPPSPPPAPTPPPLPSFSAQAVIHLLKDFGDFWRSRPVTFEGPQAAERAAFFKETMALVASRDALVLQEDFGSAPSYNTIHQELLTLSLIIERLLKAHLAARPIFHEESGMHILYHVPQDKKRLMSSHDLVQLYEVARKADPKLALSPKCEALLKDLRFMSDKLARDVFYTQNKKAQLLQETLALSRCVQDLQAQGFGMKASAHQAAVEKALFLDCSKEKLKSLETQYGPDAVCGAAMRILSLKSTQLQAESSVVLFELMEAFQNIHPNETFPLSIQQPAKDKAVPLMPAAKESAIAIDATRLAPLEQKLFQIETAIATLDSLLQTRSLQPIQGESADARRKREEMLRALLTQAEALIGPLRELIANGHAPTGAYSFAQSLLFHEGLLAETVLGCLGALRPLKKSQESNVHAFFEVEKSKLSNVGREFYRCHKPSRLLQAVEAHAPLALTQNEQVALEELDSLSNQSRYGHKKEGRIASQLTEFRKAASERVLVDQGMVPGQEADLNARAAIDKQLKAQMEQELFIPALSLLSGVEKILQVAIAESQTYAS